MDSIVIIKTLTNDSIDKSNINYKINTNINYKINTNIDKKISVKSVFDDIKWLTGC